MTHYWFWKRRLPERKNEPCTILLRVPRTNSIVVQFADGFMVNTSRWAVRIGLRQQALYARIYDRKWSIERALTEPLNKVTVVLDKPPFEADT